MNTESFFASSLNQVRRRRNSCNKSGIGQMYSSGVDLLLNMYLVSTPDHLNKPKHRGM